MYLHSTHYSGLKFVTLNVSNHNGTLSADHFLDLKSIPRVSTQQISFDRIFSFIDHVLTVYYEESVCSSTHQQAYVTNVLA